MSFSILGDESGGHFGSLAEAQHGLPLATDRAVRLHDPGDRSRPHGGHCYCRPSCRADSAVGGARLDRAADQATSAQGTQNLHGQTTDPDVSVTWRCERAPQKLPEQGTDTSVVG